MLSKILVPLDGSVLAEGVLPHVEALGRQGGTLVTLLHVVDPETLEPKDPVHAPYVAQMVSRAEARARDYLRHVEERTWPLVTSVNSKVFLGPAADQIVDTAERGGYDLIAMSTHGRSGLGRWVFGSVADRVLHATRKPLLLVRPSGADGSEPVVALQRVLLPLDGSELAEEAIPYAVELARRLGLEIKVVRVLQYQDGAGFGLYVEDPTEILRKTAESYLEEVEARLQAERVAATSALLWGSPGGQILDVADKEQGTIVCMASHGRSGIGRWVLGSVADKVVRGVGIPVLLIRPRVAREPRAADPLRASSGLGSEIPYVGNLP